MLKARFELNTEEIFLDAKKDGVSDQLEDELYCFSKLLLENYELKLFLEDPRIANDYKKKMLKKLFPEGISENFVAAVFLLIDKGREELVEELSSNITKMFFKEKGVLFGEVASVCPIPAKQQKKIESVMGELEKKTVRLRFGLDPEILGGMRISFINGEVWDISLAHKLTDIKAAILS